MKESCIYFYFNMAMSLPQEQCPVQCQLCEGDPKVKWKCLVCDLLMCSKCKDKVHSKFKSEKYHRIIDIKDVGQQSKGVYQQDKEVTSQPESRVPSSPTNVKLINIKQYNTKMEYISLLAVSVDGSLWIGNGNEKEGFHLFTSYTALQNVKLVGDKVKVISSFNKTILDIAVTPTHDILLATYEPRLKQIKAGSNRVTDSIYFTDLSYIKSVHVTKDGRVIVGEGNVVVVMDTDGKHLKRYKRDKNNGRPIFYGNILSITSTLNGNIFVIQTDAIPRVAVLGEGDSVNYYKGHYSIEGQRRFNPESVIATPMDNVIVAELTSDTYTLHILDNTGHLLTTYNTMNIGIRYPRSLAITMEGNFAVLYIGCNMSYRDSFYTGRLYKMNIMGC